MISDRTRTSYLTGFRVRESVQRDEISAQHDASSRHHALPNHDLRQENRRLVGWLIGWLVGPLFGRFVRQSVSSNFYVILLQILRQQGQLP